MSEQDPNKIEAEDAQGPEAAAPAEETETAAPEEAPADAASAEAEGAPDDASADAGDGQEAEDGSPWSGGDAAEAEVAEEDAAQRIEDLEAQVAELNDKLLRALAETENVRRRAQRDKEDTAKYGIKNFAEGMLGVADNLGRALASVDADARAADANLENIYVGVEMVQKDLVSTFERYGITPIKALGAKFDPMLHEAMFEIENADTPAGTIAQVLEPGYTLHGRTLRAAKVGITKGGPKEAPAAPAETPEAETAEPDADPTDPATREGQAAYETQSEPKTASGGNLDQEL